MTLIPEALDVSLIPPRKHTVVWKGDEYVFWLKTWGGDEGTAFLILLRSISQKRSGGKDEEDKEGLTVTLADHEAARVVLTLCYEDGRQDFDLSIDGGNPDECLPVLLNLVDKVLKMPYAVSKSLSDAAKGLNDTDGDLAKNSEGTENSGSGSSSAPDGASLSVNSNDG